MPQSDYYRGEGRKVMRSMRKKYGEEAGKRIFYATANKKGLASKKAARKTARKSA